MLRILCALVLLVCNGMVATVHAGNVVIESWRSDDKALWEGILIPAFQKRHAAIDIKYLATAPTEYDAALATRFANGSAGDLVACRPFQVAQNLYKNGYLEKLDGKAGMENFPLTALVAWQTDDAKTSYCMPIASVIHGFLYNKKIFRKLNLQPPKTQAEFFAVLEAVKKQGLYQPLALGTAEKWEATQTVFLSIGPNFWHGEAGRKALINGSAKFTDKDYVAALDYQAKLGKYLSKDAASQTYSESQQLFAAGKAAIYPLGSWDISYFNQIAGLEFGVFAPPVQNSGDQCYILDHMDIGIGVNKKSKNKEEAYKILEWLGSQEFADLYTNRATGFFSLSNHLIPVRDPIGKQMMEWRHTCESTIRINAQLNARTQRENQVVRKGQMNLEQEFWNLNISVLNGNLSSKDAALKIQNGFSQWSKPQNK